MIFDEKCQEGLKTRQDQFRKNLAVVITTTNELCSYEVLLHYCIDFNDFFPISKFCFYSLLSITFYFISIFMALSYSDGYPEQNDPFLVSLTVPCASCFFLFFFSYLFFFLVPSDNIHGILKYFTAYISNPNPNLI